MEHSLKRPTPEDTDEDLLRMQLELVDALVLTSSRLQMSTKTNPMPSQSAVRAHSKVAEETKRNAEKTKFLAKKRGGRFTLDLDVLKEESTAQVLFSVQEKNAEYLEGTHRKPFCFSGLGDEYSKDDGFPDVLDLSRYFIPDESGELYANPKDGRSLFAIEFDRLSGKVEVSIFLAAVDDYCSGPSTADKQPPEESEAETISKENMKRIQAMSKEELLSAQREIVERFDPKIIEFLKTRSKKKTDTITTASSHKESRFRQIRDMGKERAEELMREEEGARSKEMIVEDKVKELEVFPTKVAAAAGKSCACEDRDAAYTRLAIEAVQLDFASKCLRRIIPRQQQNIVRLFDSFRTPIEGYEGNDELLEMARSNLPSIKGLYLEEMNSESGATYRFMDGLNPVTDGAWTLLPIRKVLDTCQKDFQVAVEDVVVVRLCLLWSLLMLTERGSLFHMCNKVEDVYVRLAEIFLIGPEVFKDDVVKACADRVFRSYVIPKAKHGPEVFKDDVVKACADRVFRSYVIPKAKHGELNLIATEPVAKLDAFMPFYEDLMRHFEEFAVGDELFSLVLLIGAYMNSTLMDSLMMRCALWSPERKIIRQMTLGKGSADFLLQHLASVREYWSEEMEDQYYAQYSQMLAMYAAAIRNSEVTRDRNPLLFEIAATELGYFVKRHSKGDTQTNPFVDRERIKEFDILVDIIRTAVAGRLQL
uniref:RNA polymerase II-associated protein 1 N-terminal domain-containing protein n=1 Tax=Ascaris lumbricoides TaxID=6252 RepID=A0A9J2P4Y4_ASCLU